MCHHSQCKGPQRASPISAQMSTEGTELLLSPVPCRYCGFPGPLSPPVLLQLEASTLLSVALKKSFLWSELGRKIIQCQLRAEQKESAEKGKSSMRTKRDKVLLRISSPRGNRLGRRRMPAGSRGEREEWEDVRREDLGTEKPNPLTAGRKRGTLKLWRQIFTPGVRVKTDRETCRKKTPGRKMKMVTNDARY